MAELRSGSARGSVPGGATAGGGGLPEQSPCRMFPIRAADIARESLFSRARSATLGGRDGGSTQSYIKDSGVRSVTLDRQTTGLNRSHGATYLQDSPGTRTNGVGLDTVITNRRIPLGMSASYPSTPAVGEALTVPDFPKPTPGPPKLGITRPPRLPWQTRRAMSASLTSVTTRNKLLHQRPDLPNFAITMRKEIPEVRPTKSDSLLSVEACTASIGTQTPISTGTQFPSPPDKPEKSFDPEGNTCQDIDRPLPKAPSSPKPLGPISAWTKEPEARRSARTSKRACFKENVDVFYYDTEEKPTETESRDFEKLKDDESDSITSEETMADDLSSDSSSGGNESQQKTLSSQSTSNLQEKPTVESSPKNVYSKGNVTVARNSCFKQEIELVPNVDDAHESLIRKEMCRLAVIVQIEGACIKQLTSVKAMSGGRTLIVVTHRPADFSEGQGRGYTGLGQSQVGGPSMVLVQHVDKLRLPVVIDPYSVKAHIHKDWTLRIEAPVREWLDCPSAVLRCRLPLAAHAGVSFNS